MTATILIVIIYYDDILTIMITIILLINIMILLLLLLIIIIVIIIKQTIIIIMMMMFVLLLLLLIIIIIIITVAIIIIIIIIVIIIIIIIIFNQCRGRPQAENDLNRKDDNPLDAGRGRCMRACKSCRRRRAAAVLSHLQRAATASIAYVVDGAKLQPSGVICNERWLRVSSSVAGSSCSVS